MLQAEHLLGPHDELIGLRGEPPDQRDIRQCWRCRHREPLDHGARCPICGHSMHPVRRDRRRILAVVQHDIGSPDSVIEVIEAGFLPWEDENIGSFALVPSESARRRDRRINGIRRSIAAPMLKRGMHPWNAADRVDNVYDRHGYWHKTCPDCGEPFKVKRQDGGCPKPRCRKRRARRVSA